MKDNRWLHEPQKIKKDGNLIPEGTYCYNGNYTCPFWGMIKTHPSYENGYCSFIDKGDWETGGLLWDQCKECGINENIEEIIREAPPPLIERTES